jgi:hypothetical protein
MEEIPLNPPFCKGGEDKGEKRDKISQSLCSFEMTMGVVEMTEWGWE